MEYAAISLYRFLYKRERLYRTEKAFLRFIRNKLPGIASAKQVTEEFRELKSELTELSKDPYEKTFLDTLDLVSWLEGEIEQKPMSEIIRAKFSATS